MSKHTGAHHVREALGTWLDSDDEAVLIGEAVGHGGGLMGSTEGLAALHPDRVLVTPIGERSALGLGIGMALGGRSVCVELSSAQSLLQAAGLLADLASFQGTEFRPNLVIRVPHDLGAGPLVDAPVGNLLLGLPGLGVHVARSETVAGLLSATLGRGAHVLLESAELYSRRSEPATVAPGRLRVLRHGDHVLLAAWGAGVDAARHAADELATEGIEATVVDLVSMSPLDPSLGEHARRTGRVVAVHSSDPGLGERVLRSALESAFLYLESPLDGCSAAPSAVVEAARRSVHY